MSVTISASQQFDSHVPIVVIGAGACGLTAALAASDEGAAVLVLERDDFPSGSTGMSYGAICAAGTRLQEEAGVADQVAWLEADILAITRGETDAGLAALIAAHAGPTVEWLVDTHRINLTVETSWKGMGHRQPRLHAPPDRSGQTLINMLQAAADSAGVDVLTSARVTELVADHERRVRGVVIARPDGTSEMLGADAVVLATCGFGANHDMVARYMPAVANARYYGHEGNDGDGIRWGMALGAAVADMGAYQALGSLADPQAAVIPHTLLIGGGVQVNARGERFENELDNISGQALTILEQPGGCCWMVYDERLHNAALERFEEYRQADSIKAPRRAATIAGLAEQCALPAQPLARTFATIDAFAKDDGTDDFGRRFRSSERLKPPYFAIRVTGALFHTQGGLCVNEQAQLVDEKGRALPNVFAGGGTARSVSGPGEWGYLPGMGLCTAVTLGRIAGQAAAALLEP